MCPCNHKPCTCCTCCTCCACCACNELASEPTRQPHKHAALIKAWAAGAKIQIHRTYREDWVECCFPTWEEQCTYRIKPVPKPDIVCYSRMEGVRGSSSTSYSKWNTHNIKHVYDGETGNLKSVSML